MQTLTVLSSSATVPLSLPAGGSDVVTLVPIQETGGVALAPIGLVSMLNPGGAVLSCRLEAGADVAAADQGQEQEDDSIRCHLTLRGCGQVLIYASQPPFRLEVEGEAVEFGYIASPMHRLTFEIETGAAAVCIYF